MKKSLIFAFMTLLFLSCASIVSQSTYSIKISANPSDARVTITDLNGTEVFTGKVPAVVQLDAAARYFKKNQYTLTFSAPGYEEKSVPLLCKVDGWYWGNLILGGVVGMLIIDPATGAMYKFQQESISATLSAKDSSTLIIKTVNDLSLAQKKNLELIGYMTII